MKKIALLIFPFLVFASQNLCAQTPETKKDTILIVEKMPEFPGGEKALVNYLRKNVVYADSLQWKRVEGTVYTNFIIDNKGQIGDVTVIRGVHPALDAEAVRVIKAMPNWAPGTQGGKPVKVQYHLPIQFKL